MGASGTCTVSFGAVPGKTDAMVTVTGQAGILAGSRVEVWIEVPASVAGDHQPDEYWVEDLAVYGGTIVAGVGFTAYVKCNTGHAVGDFVLAWVWN